MATIGKHEANVPTAQKILVRSYNRAAANMLLAILATGGIVAAIVYILGMAGASDTGYDINFVRVFAAAVCIPVLNNVRKYALRRQRRASKLYWACSRLLANTSEDRA